MFEFFKKFIIIILFILFLFSCNNSKTIIAKYDIGALYLKESVDEFNNLPETQKKELNNDDGYYRFIRKMALERIILDNAYKNEIDKSDNFKNMLEKAKKNTAFEVLKKKNVVDKIIVGKEDYKKYKKRYELYQIVKRKDLLDQAKVEESKNLLIKISKEIKDLSTFIEYAKKYSDDPDAFDDPDNTDDIGISSGGYVGKITLGIMEETIDEELKKLKIKEVSGIVESTMGFHILFINDIEEVGDDELYKSNELFEAIYREKRASLEEDWYKKLLKDSDLKVYKNLIKDKIYDSQVVAEYKGSSITRDQFFKVVDNYKINSFPEPTEEDLEKLLNNMALDLVLEKKSESKAIYDSKDYKEKIKEKIKFLLINEYINKNLVIPQISEEKIKDFYDKNLKTMFTFQLDNGKLFIQPLDEVKKMIIQRLEEDNKQEAKYNLYRKIVDDSNLKINEDLIKEFKKRIKI